jgi:hypothetical protein
MKSVSSSALFLALCVFVARPGDCEAQVQGKVGVGSGLAYGTVLLGAGAEIELVDRVAVLGGIGLGTAQSPWAYGARLYLQPAQSRWRPHLSAMHWTEGNGLYLGLDQDLGQPGGVVLSYGVGFGRVNLETNVGITAGIGYRWSRARSPE